MPCMNDTRMTPEWIQSKVLANPLRELLGKDGQPSAIFSSGVVRLSYPNLLKAKANNQDASKAPSYSTALWFTPFHNLAPLYDCGKRLIAAHKKLQIGQLTVSGAIPSNISGMLTPFHDQGEKLPASGYTSGCMFLNCRTDRKPPVRRFAAGELVNVGEHEEERVYGGMWGIVTFNMFIPKENRKDNVPARLCAGLMNALLFADDEAIGATRIAPEVAFAGVQGAEELGMPSQEAVGQAMGAGAAFMPSQPVTQYGQPAFATQGQQYAPAQQMSAEEIAFRRSMGMAV